MVGLLSFLGVPRPVWCLALAPILFFYTATTGMSASALRACLMAVLQFEAPLLFGVGMASCCGLIAGIVSPWGEAVFNHAAGALAQVMAWVAQATAALPGCSMTIAKPTEWDVAGWYAVLLMLSWALWRYTQEGDTGATWIKVPRGSA